MNLKDSRIEGFISTQDEYIKLLEKEIADMSGLCHVHEWRSGRYEQGKKLREKIANLKKLYDKSW